MKTLAFLYRSIPKLLSSLAAITIIALATAYTPLPILIGIQAANLYSSDTDINLSGVKGSIVNGFNIESIKLFKKNIDVRISNLKFAPIIDFKNRHVAIDFGNAEDILITESGNHPVKLKDTNFNILIKPFEDNILQNLSLSSNNINIYKENFQGLIHKDEKELSLSLTADNGELFINFIKNKSISIKANHEEIGNIFKNVSGNIEFDILVDLVSKQVERATLKGSNLNSPKASFDQIYGNICDNNGFISIDKLNLFGNNLSNYKISLKSEEKHLSLINNFIYKDNQVNTEIYIKEFGEKTRISVENILVNDKSIRDLIEPGSIIVDYNKSNIDITTTQDNNIIKAYGNYNLKNKKHSVTISGKDMYIGAIDNILELPFHINNKHDFEFSAKGTSAHNALRAIINLKQASFFENESNSPIHNIDSGILYIEKNDDSYLIKARTTLNERKNLNIDLRLVDVDFTSLDTSLPKAYGSVFVKIEPKILRMLSKKFSDTKGEISASINVNGDILSDSTKFRLYGDDLKISLPSYDQNISRININGSFVNKDISFVGNILSKDNLIQLKGLLPINLSGAGNIHFSSGSSNFKFSTDKYKVNADLEGDILFNDAKIDNVLAKLTLKDKCSIEIDNSHSTDIFDISPDIVFTGKSKNKTISYNEQSYFPHSIQLITSEAPLRLKGYGFDAMLKGNLNISTKKQGIYLADGTLSIVKGSYSALGKQFEILQGTIAYLPGTSLGSPFISIKLKQVMSSSLDKPIYAWLYGPINKLQANFSNENVFSFSNNPSLDTSSNAIVAQIANASGNDLTTKLQKSFKLDELSLESNSSNASDINSLDQMFIMVGKQLTKKLYIRYKKGVNDISSKDDINALMLNYKLNKIFSINLETGPKNQEVSLQLTYDQD